MIFWTRSWRIGGGAAGNVGYSGGRAAGNVGDSIGGVYSGAVGVGVEVARYSGRGAGGRASGNASVSRGDILLVLVEWTLV